MATRSAEFLDEVITTRRSHRLYATTTAILTFVALRRLFCCCCFGGIAVAPVPRRRYDLPFESMRGGTEK